MCHPDFTTCLALNFDVKMPGGSARFRRHIPEFLSAIPYRRAPGARAQGAPDFR